MKGGREVHPWHDWGVLDVVPSRRPSRSYLPDECVLLTGDNVASLGGTPILGPFNVARQEAIESFRRLAAMDVEIACFGHGDPILGDAQGELLNAADRL